MIDTQTADPQLSGAAMPPGRSDEALVSYLTGYVEAAIDRKMAEIRSTLLGLKPSQLDLSAESLGMIRLLAARSNQSKDDIIAKALTLYGLALDAVERGNRLAVLDADDMIVHDVLGVNTEQSNGTVSGDVRNGRAVELE